MKKIVSLFFLLLLVGCVSSPTHTISGVAYQIENFHAPGPCELYIHGNSAPSIWMQPSISLRQGKCIVTIDLPGHGRSMYQSSYTLDIMINAITDIIAQTKLNERAEGYYIIGWSYGGDLAIHALAEKKLSNMRGLILVGTSPISLIERGLPSQFRSDTFATNVISESYHLSGTLRDDQLIELGQSYYCPNYKNSESCVTPPELLRSVQRVDQNVRSDILASVLSGMVRDEISILSNREADVRLCVFYSENDALLNPEYFAATNRIVSPDMTSIFISGHAIMFSEPALFNLALDQCLLQIENNGYTKAPLKSGAFFYSF